MLHRRFRLMLVPALLMLFLLSACEDSINPILQSDRYFTIWGTLDMVQDTQYVRVVPIRELVFADPNAPFNVTLTSEDLATGERVEWRDSLINFRDGSTGHVFYAPLRIRPSHTYRIEVHSLDHNVTTTAQTTVPDLPTPEVFPENVSNPIGGNIQGTQQIVWRGISEQPFELLHWYRFLLNPVRPFRDEVSLAEVSSSISSNGDALEVTLNLATDRAGMDEILEVKQHALMGLGMRITMLDSEFTPPGGAFDPEILVQPGTMSNVENGFGFIGSVGRFSVEWILEDQSMRILNYLTPIDAFGKSTLEIIQEMPAPEVSASTGTIKLEPVYRR